MVDTVFWKLGLDKAKINLLMQSILTLASGQQSFRAWKVKCLRVTVTMRMEFDVILNFILVVAKLLPLTL